VYKVYNANPVYFDGNVSMDFLESYFNPQVQFHFSSRSVTEYLAPVISCYDGFYVVQLYGISANNPRLYPPQIVNPATSMFI
jgi:hypothetical protein